MSAELKQSPALRTLSEDLRDKALEYAAALGARGPRPTTVLGTAVTLAKEWGSGRLPEVGEADRGVALLVQPRQGRWIIRRANAAEATHVFSLRDDAVRRAQELSRLSASPVFVFGPGGTLLERYAPPSQTALRTPAPRPTIRPIARPIAHPPARDSAAPVARERPAEEPAPPAVAPSPSVVVAAVAVEVTDVAITPASAPPSVEGAEVRVVKAGRKWAVEAPDGTRTLFPTRRKAEAHAATLSRA